MPDFWPFCQGGGQRSIQASRAVQQVAGLTTATQSMSSESSACSQVFNLAQWHNGTMIPDSTTIPQDPQGFSATSALCNKSENAANTWDTIWYNGCSWLKRIMVNYAVLAKIVAFIYPYVGQRHILWAVPVSLSEYLWREPSGPINHDQSSFWVKNVP